MRTLAAITATILLFGIGVHGAEIRPARKVLPKLVLGEDLAAAVQTAESLITTHVRRNARRLLPLASAAENLELENVLFDIEEGTSVELTNMKLNNAPVVEVISVEPKLEFLNMKVELNLGSLRVGGSYEVSSKKILSVLPITNFGEFSVDITDVRATGIVGLSLVEDSFSAINLDIMYQVTEVFLQVVYQSKDGQATSVNTEKDGVIVGKINKKLRHVLHYYVKRYLDEMLAEMSVEELLGNSKARDDYAEHAKAVAVLANDYVDEVLSTVDNYLLTNNLQTIQIPDINQGFSKKILWVTWHGEFYTRDGYVENLSTLTRTADVSLAFDETTGTITVFGGLGLTQLALGYGTYSAKFMGIGPSGSVGATVGSNSLFIRISAVLSPEPKITLEDLHIEYAKNIQIHITGLGILDWLVSTIATWVVAIFNEQIVGALDGKLLDIVQSLLSSVDPGKYFA